MKFLNRMPDPAAEYSTQGIQVVDHKREHIVLNYPNILYLQTDGSVTQIFANRNGKMERFASI